MRQDVASRHKNLNRHLHDIHSRHIFRYVLKIFLYVVKNICLDYMCWRYVVQHIFLICLERYVVQHIFLICLEHMSWKYVSTYVLKSQHVCTDGMSWAYALKICLEYMRWRYVVTITSYVLSICVEHMCWKENIRRDTMSWKLHCMCWTYVVNICSDTYEHMCWNKKYMSWHYVVTIYIVCPEDMSWTYTVTLCLENYIICGEHM